MPANLPRSERGIGQDVNDVRNEMERIIGKPWDEMSKKERARAFNEVKKSSGNDTHNSKHYPRDEGKKKDDGH